MFAVNLSGKKNTVDFYYDALLLSIAIQFVIIVITTWLIIRWDATLFTRWENYMIRVYALSPRPSHDHYYYTILIDTMILESCSL